MLLIIRTSLRKGLLLATSLTLAACAAPAPVSAPAAKSSVGTEAKVVATIAPKAQPTTALAGAKVVATVAPKAQPTLAPAAKVVATIAPKAQPTLVPAATAATASGAAMTGVKIATANTPLGALLVGDAGHTLYAFTKDTKDTSTCYDDCAKKWPPLLTDGSPQAGNGINAKLLSTAKRKDGKLQVIYNDMPLYYFSDDKAPGDTKGEELGEAWYAVSPAGAAIHAKSEAVKPSDTISASAAQTITIKGSEYMFTMPDQIQAGLVTINWENDGKEAHSAQFARLNDSVTADQFQAALKKSPDGALPLVTLLGGPGTIDPGSKQSVVLDLPEGQYFVLCFVRDAKGVPHLAEGMIHQLKVVAAPNAAKPAEPKADSTVSLKDFAFALPQEIKAGAQTWKVSNEGSQPHELRLIKLKDGKTEKDAIAFMQQPQGSAPFEAVGGMQALNQGKSAWAMLDLAPGNYVALCNVIDSKTGKPHSELGMVMPFTVK
jgi:predicted lipoprotein with Yx(FWY)xxD motif